ncbi:MAG: FAD-dependent oxidoreductase [Pirellula sp.]|nr:FAD-dependent oxidoreductase [Pirellula sp.]
MKPEPFWKRSALKRFPAPKRAAPFDVVVIGGGITGLTTAYLLKQAGKRVAVLERDRIGSGDTGYTTAHLTYVTDLRAAELVDTFGLPAARLVWQAGATAIDAIEGIVADERVECDFRRVPGYLHAPRKKKRDERAALEKDVDAARQMGFAVRYLPQAPLFDCEGIRFPDQAKFDPLKYLAGLAAAVDGDGSQVFENAEVDEVSDEPLHVTVKKHKLTTDYVVIATHVPLMGKTGMMSAALFQTKLYSYSSYAIGAKVPHGRLPEACFWDTADPYHYLRVEAGAKHDYVIYGGHDHKTGQVTDTQPRFDSLASELREIVPGAVPDRQWSGQVVETNDGLPYIGESAVNQFVATGFSGNGMTFGTVAALMARDAVLKRDNPWKKLFAVDRKKLRGGTWDYLTENIDFPYYYLKDRLLKPADTSARGIAPGCGKVIEIGGEHVACARDDEGTLHQVSAVCTHMGCLVRFNDAEHTWDCPCHGSRFHLDGKVLAGPAETPLEPVKGAAKSKAKPKTTANGASSTRKVTKKPSQKAKSRS